MASPEFGPWWVQWGRVARGLSQHQVCSRKWTNPFVVGFVQEASEWIACPRPSLIPEAQHAPSTPSSVECWECALKSPHFCILETEAHPWAWLETWERVMQSVVQNHRDQDGARTSVIPNQSKEISSLESVISWNRDVIGGIQPRFMYQSTSPYYYELMEH